MHSVSRNTQNPQILFDHSCHVLHETCLMWLTNHFDDNNQGVEVEWRSCIEREQLFHSRIRKS